MAASIEFDSGLRRDYGSDVVVGDGRGQFLRRRVEVRDVGVVVLRVVELHDRAADHGLERAVLVAEGRQRRLRARMRLEEARGPVRVMRFCARIVTLGGDDVQRCASGCQRASCLQLLGEQMRPAATAKDVFDA